MVFPFNKKSSEEAVFCCILPDIIRTFSDEGRRDKKGRRDTKERRGNEKGERNSFGIYDAKLALRYISQNMAFFGFEPVQYYYWPRWMEFQSLLENTAIVFSKCIHIMATICWTTEQLLTKHTFALYEGKG